MTTSTTIRMNAETAPLGYSWDPCELYQYCQVTYGAVAWPSNRSDKLPGFAVVVGLAHERHFGGHDVYLLAEAETLNMQELVAHCAVLDGQFQPERWISDTRNHAADLFIKAVNAESRTPDPRPLEQRNDRRTLRLTRPPLLDIERPYEFFIPQLRKLLDENHRQLFLKESRVKEYLSRILADDAPSLEWGDYPAIEAVCLAVLEIRARTTQRTFTAPRAPDVFRRRRWH